jgi:hypothetical protein
VNTTIFRGSCSPPWVCKHVWPARWTLVSCRTGLWTAETHGLNKPPPEGKVHTISHFKAGSGLYTPSPSTRHITMKQARYPGLPHPWGLWWQTPCSLDSVTYFWLAYWCFDMWLSKACMTKESKSFRKSRVTHKILPNTNTPVLTHWRVSNLESLLEHSMTSTSLLWPHFAKAPFSSSPLW